MAVKKKLVDRIFSVDVQATENALWVYKGKTAKERSCIWFQDGPAGGCCTVVRINLRLLVKIRALSFRLCAPARFVQPTCQGHSAGCVGQTFTWGAIRGDTGPPWIFFPRANHALYLACFFLLTERRKSYYGISDKFQTRDTCYFSQQRNWSRPSRVPNIW